MLDSTRNGPNGIIVVILYLFPNASMIPVKAMASTQDIITIGNRLTQPNQQPKPASNFMSPPPKPSLFRHNLYIRLTKKKLQKPEIPPITDGMKSMPVNPK